MTVKDAAPPPRFPLLLPLAVRDFRLLWMGESVSVLGDQFYLVALPWLVLLLTGSSVALGTIYLVASIPRAALVLLGGAVTDRANPRLLALASNLARGLLVGIVGGLIFVHHAGLWELYALALLFGIADAAFYPAMNVLTPLLLDEPRRAGGNALMQGTTQIGGLIGPTLAGILIAVLPLNEGNGLAFGIDAASFLIAALTLFLIRGRRSTAVLDVAAGDSPGLLASVGEGLRYAWSDPVPRALVLVSVALNSTNGATTVGLPTLAHVRFSHGSAALGLMLSAEAAGGLLGTAIGGSLRRPPPRGLTLITLAFSLSAATLVLGITQFLAVDVAVLLLLGAGAGFTNILMITWLQARTASEVLGRVFSLFSFTGLALIPISVVAAGAIAAVSVTLLFSIAAGILFLAAAGTASSKTIRSVR